MQRSRQKVSVRLLIVAYGLVGGLILFWIKKTAQAILESFPNYHVHSVFFGDMVGWPDFFKGFIPLDIAFFCLLVGLLAYLVAVKFIALVTSTKEKKWPQLLVIVAGVAGFFGGSMGGLVGSWFTGFELFFIASILVAAVIFALRLVQVTWSFLRFRS